MVTWRQSARWLERVGMEPDGEPTYSYVVLDESEPEIVDDFMPDRRSPGRLGATTWRKF